MNKKRAIKLMHDLERALYLAGVDPPEIPYSKLQYMGIQSEKVDYEEYFFKRLEANIESVKSLPQIEERVSIIKRLEDEDNK